MKFSHVLLHALTAVVLGSGCAHATLLNPSFRPAPTCSAGVTVYASRERAPADYKEIATISSGAGLEVMRKKAAEYGATGLILTDQTVTTQGGVTVGRTTTPATSSVQQNATAIFSAGDSTRVATACQR